MDTASGVVAGDRSSVPDPAWAKLWALGFEPALADYYWIQALFLVGSDTLDGVEERATVGDMIDLITGLDPWVDHPYRFAALWLTRTPEEVERGSELLRRGVAYHPDDWRNRFYLGYNEFFFLGRTDAAVEALEPAVGMPGAPAYLGPLVARLRADVGGLEAAARFLAHLSNNTEDEYLRAGYLKTLDEIEVERRARWLDDLRLEFWERHGRDLHDVTELHRGPLALVDGIPPAHPHLEGFAWEIDEESGEIVSSFYRNRYRLHLEKRERDRAAQWKDRLMKRPWREEV